MDKSTTDHSDSDSGDSWTLIESTSTYADDALDIPDRPTQSATAEHRDKDEDTDGISIITDSEPESSSPCEINCEHYLFEENLKQEHQMPQFITVNSNSPDIKCQSESKKETDDFLGDSGEKHKTYVHRRNKRLSTVLNIIMLGSVITAAGVAIGHMWGAKTDCSMHTSPNVNKILSNLYKLQEENAYLWNKLKELTALNNHQMNHKAIMKQNKCKKIFEEPLINNESKKVTKCVDDKFINDDRLRNKQIHKVAHDNNLLLKVENIKNENAPWVNDEIVKKPNQKPLKKIKHRHISKPLKHHLENENQVIFLNKIIDEGNNQNKKEIISEEYLNETEDLTNERKTYASVNYIKPINKKESKAFKAEYKYLNDNNKLLEYGSDMDFSLHYGDRDINSNSLKQEYNLLNDYTSHHKIKKRESNKSFKEETKDVNTNNVKQDKFGSEEELLGFSKDKKQKKENLKSENKSSKKKNGAFERTKITEGKKIAENVKTKKQKILFDNSFKTEYKTLNKNITPNNECDIDQDIVTNIHDDNLENNHDGKRYKTLKQKNKGKINNKKKTIPNKDMDTGSDMRDAYDSQNKNEAYGINTKDRNETPKGEFGTTEGSTSSINVNKFKGKHEKTFTIERDSPINENDSKNQIDTNGKDFLKDKKTKGDNGHYHTDLSDEDLKKDNRYTGLKQKQERKKYDRQQAYKKIKRRNKYEQWEMKGGLFKDYDDISMSSSQENLFNEPNIKDKNQKRHEQGNYKIDIVADNLHQHSKDSDERNVEEDTHLNWLDKRATFRTEARQKLDQESFVKNGFNTAGWYFRRMRKREHSRGKGDNSTYQKLIKRKF